MVSAIWSVFLQVCLAGACVSGSTDDHNQAAYLNCMVVLSPIIPDGVLKSQGYMFRLIFQLSMVIVMVTVAIDRTLVSRQIWG